MTGKVSDPTPNQSRSTSHTEHEPIAISGIGNRFADPDRPNFELSLNPDASGVEAAYPLSPLQEGMLFHSLQSAETGVYIEQMVMDLKEKIDVAEFLESWQKVINRHPVLRTSFTWLEPPQPMQLVHGQTRVVFDQLDWRDFSAQEQEQRFQDFLNRDRKRGFVMTEPPLLRVALFTFNEEHFRCVWTFHHAILDGRSFTIIVKELFSIYDALCDHQQWSSDTPRPYQDFINWLQQGSLEDARVFWRRCLEGFTNPNALAFGFPEVNSRGYGVQKTALSEEVTSTLEALAKHHQLTLNTLVQGAWAILLSHYTGENDIVYGTTRSGRHFPIDGAKSMVGLFINTVPLRASIYPEMSALDVLKQLRQQSIAARPYEHTPLYKIQEWSEIPRGSQLFDSILIFENYVHNSSLQSQGGKWINREFRVIDQTNYPLTLAAYVDSTLLLSIEYDRSRFDRATMIRLLAHLKELLISLTTGLEKQIHELSFMPSQERHQLLVEWSNAHSYQLPGKCIHELFEEQVIRTPDHIAVASEKGQLTYQELNQRANQLARYLNRLGAAPGTIVGICMERSLEVIVGLLGILKAGAAYIPFDPTHPEDRLLHALQDSKSPFLLTQHDLFNDLPGYRGRIIHMDADWQHILHEETSDVCHDLAATNLAYIIYTSGSTGKPKGVMIEHRALVRFTQAAAALYNIGIDDRVLQFASTSFDASAEEIYTSLTGGATLVLRNDEMLTSVEYFLKKCAEWKLTVLDLPTAFWHQLTGELNTTTVTFPESLRLTIIGGEKANASSVAEWFRRTPRSIRLVNTYGPTEATVVATAYEFSAAENFEQAPIGRPLQNVETYILDQYLQPVPIGVAGQLYIGGESLARGYLHQEQLTAEKFIANPFSDQQGARLYKTGDQARYLPDGNIEFLGRLDQQVKIRGFRVELGEIEAVLSQHPAVRQNVISVLETDNGDRSLVVYVVPVSKDFSDVTTLREFLQKRLPDYMVPARFLFLDSLPLTPNGKTDRRALPKPDMAMPSLPGDQISAGNETQAKLVKIWEDLLQVHPIGIRSNFFELGGHSLMAVRMFSRINEQFGVNLPLATLLHEATIEYLTTVIQSESESRTWSSLITIEPAGTHPPVFCVHGLTGDILWFRDLAHCLAPDFPFYGLQSRGLDGIQTPLESIEEMATQYIEEIRQVRPKGPYNLAGASFGGTVALEMAQQLLAQGEEVSMLVSFDNTPPNVDVDLGHSKLKKSMIVLYRLLRNFPAWLKEFTKLGPSRIWLRVSRTVRLMRKFKRGTDQFRLERLGADDLIDFASELAEHRQQLITYNFHAVEKYVPKPYAGNVVLFRASKRPLLQAEDPEDAWQKLAPGRVQTFDIPSSHEGMFKQPYVQAMAEKLRTCLNKQG